MDEIEEDIKINNGFDRGIDYKVIKEKLLKCINNIYKKYQEDPSDIGIKRLVYAVIALIQLRNGSRISEAVKAFILFIKNGINSRVTIKVSKTGAIKVKKDGKKFRTKVRAREMMWPSWISPNIYELLKDNPVVQNVIATGKLKKRVLDFLLVNFNCNTHSLRYAFINYALYDLKRPMNDVAKFVGHANTAQMVTYTQAKNSNEIFNLDI